MGYGIRGCGIKDCGMLAGCRAGSSVPGVASCYAKSLAGEWTSGNTRKNSGKQNVDKDHREQPFGGQQGYTQAVCC